APDLAVRRSGIRSSSILETDLPLHRRRRELQLGSRRSQDQCRRVAEAYREEPVRLLARQGASPPRQAPARDAHRTGELRSVAAATVVDPGHAAREALSRAQRAARRTARRGPESLEPRLSASRAGPLIAASCARAQRLPISPDIPLPVRFPRCRT